MKKGTFFFSSSFSYKKYPLKRKEKRKGARGQSTWLSAWGLLQGCPIGEGDLKSTLEQGKADAEAQQASQEHPQHCLEAGSPAAGEGAGGHDAQQGRAHSQGVHDGHPRVEGHDLPKLGKGGNDAKEQWDSGDDGGEGTGDDRHTHVPDCFHCPPLPAGRGVLEEGTALLV